MVFLDDNPFERNMVRSAIPDIQVPELPEDPAEFIGFLSAQNLFETASYLRGDKSKAKQYRAEAERLEVQKTFANESDYLASLDMRAELQEFTGFNTPRVAQLTQRSNQFNLRTRRYTEDDIIRFAESDQYVDMAFTLADKYGNHGLICVVILELRENVAFIDTWLMSCRVLKRGVESFVLNAIVAKARELGLQTVIGEFLPTPKNAMVAGHYQGLGFAEEDDHWLLPVGAYEDRRCLITTQSSLDEN
jgi:FkbH-like protein